MHRRTRLQTITAGFILSGLLLSHQAQAREWLLAQAQPQKQPQSQKQPPSQPNPAQPKPQQSPPPGLGVPAVVQPNQAKPSPRERRQNPFYRYSTPRNQGGRTTNRINGRDRQFPLDPVPMPDERRMPIETEPKKTIPRVPNSFAPPSTGILARVVVTPLCSIASSNQDCVTRPYQGELKVTTISRDRQFRVSTNTQGQLQLRLDPGVYVIQPTSPDFPAATSQTVTVISGMMRSMNLEFQSQTKPQPLPKTPPRPLPGQTLEEVSGQTPGQPLPQQPLRPPGSTWQPSVVPQPLYPPIGSF